MANKGIDVNVALTTAQCAALVQAGITFVLRYMGATKKEPITYEEAQRISDSGLYLGIIYENGRMDLPTYYNRPAGLRDGDYIVEQMQKIHAPPDAPIDICYDLDATTAQLYAYLLPYAAAVHSSLKPASITTGAYGSGLTLHTLQEAGLISHTFKAFPRGWAGYDLIPNPNLLQTSNDSTLNLSDRRMVLSVDDDAAFGASGTWQLPKTT